MFKRVMKRETATGTVPVEFKYDGGAYIDLYFGSFVPLCLHCINVYDYKEGRSRVNTLKEFNATVVDFWHNEQDVVDDCIRELSYYL